MSELTEAQAFPTSINPHSHEGKACSGMTLRDYFAGQVLAGIAANPSFPHSLDDPRTAARAYLTADAMLARRALSEEKNK